MTNLFILTFIDDSNLLVKENDGQLVFDYDEGTISHVLYDMAKDKEYRYICAWGFAMSKIQYVSDYIDYVEECSNELQIKIESRNDSNTKDIRS